MGKQTGAGRSSNCLAVAFALAALSAVPAYAEGDAARPAPRTAVTIGGASVVMVSANDKLYAFVDRLDDNAPVTEAALSIDLADGSNLKLTRVSDGLFTAPFNRAGHMRDAFMVSLVSPDGTGDATAEIGYDDVQTPEAPPVGVDFRGNAVVAGVSALAGAAFAAAVMLLSRSRRRRGAASAVGSAMA